MVTHLCPISYSHFDFCCPWLPLEVNTGRTKHTKQAPSSALLSVDVVSSVNPWQGETGHKPFGRFLPTSMPLPASLLPSVSLSWVLHGMVNRRRFAVGPAVCLRLKVLLFSVTQGYSHYWEQPDRCSN